MIGNIGQFLLLSSILLSILTVIVSIRKNINYAYIFFNLGIFSTILAFSLLLYGFATSDFSLQNVFLNSSTIKPIGYKIAAAWSSHEGSILLWLCLSQIISGIYIAKRPASLYQIMILSLLQILLAGFIYFTSNPFTSLSFAPVQGLGLNPTLQDIALIIHPPILYLGYVFYLIPFTCACTILIKGNIELEELRVIKIFTNLALVFLTAGVALGAWWAYRELGWGGFWFFDPVENISLLPWFSGIALYHCAIITIKSGRLQNWTVILAIITFLLALLGTFLVRSNLLLSVHSFASSAERSIYMLSIFAIISISSLSLLALRGDRLNIVASKTIRPMKYYSMILGTILFIIALIVLLYATIYPIIYSLMQQQDITVNESFFIKNFLTFIIPSFLIIGVSQTNQKNWRNLLIFVIAITIIFISSYKVKYGLISALSASFSLFLILQTLYLSLLKKSITGMLLSHFGFGLLAFTVTLNSLLQYEVDFIGKRGDHVKAKDLLISLHDIRFSSSQNYYRQIAEFWIKDSENRTVILKPENRFYIIERELSAESNIYSTIFYDLYAVLSQIEDETIHAKIYYRPLMSLIWISAILMVGGFLIAATKRRAHTSSLSS